jgi:hypothetical protein
MSVSLSRTCFDRLSMRCRVENRRKEQRDRF